MKLTAKSIVLLALMLLSAALGAALRPRIGLADERPPIDLAAMVPKSFGDWHEEINLMTQVVNPQQKEIIDKLYSQTLSRTYTNGQGDRIMLSIAYSGDYSGKVMQYHRPEICYPSQGFEILDDSKALVNSPFGQIPVKRISTRSGPRYEPLTYWVTVANERTTFGFALRWIQIKSRLIGKLPGGMLVRFSSITRDTNNAYASQEKFAIEMLGAMKVADANRIVGSIDP
jgi:EpsI family protein